MAATTVEPAKYASGDAGHAADGVEIDDGTAGSRGRKTDRTGATRRCRNAGAGGGLGFAGRQYAARSSRGGAARAAAVQRTEFAVDVGGANSLDGLRALWRGLVKSNTALAALRPIIVVKEGSNGLGMQLRLVAGPLGDAAAAAKICAALIEGQRPCETTVFDGQRLAIKADEPPVSITPAPVKPAAHKRSAAKPVATAEPKKPETSTLSSLFKRN